MMFAFVSCGYRAMEIPECTYSVLVPYVKGDVDGSLTSAIIKEIAASGIYRYQPYSSNYTLEVIILDDYFDHIGYRFDRSKKGKLKHEIIPVETRGGVLVEVVLVDSISSCVIKGPVRLQTSIEFDHDYYTIRNQVNIFSLGQLTDIDSAEDV